MRSFAVYRWSHTLEELLLQLGLGDLDLDGLVNLLLMSTLVIGIVLDGGGEEGVDEGGLSKARLASNLSEESGISMWWTKWRADSTKRHRC